MFDATPTTHTWSSAVRRPSVEVFLLGQVDFQRCLALQQQLVDACISRAGGPISLLICEHPPVITLGRSATRADVRLRQVQYAGQPIDLLNVPRGGGAVLHLPGQLAVYPIVPLETYDWSVGEFISRFEDGLLAALGELQIKGRRRPGRHGIWGRTGQLVSLGVSVQQWITSCGAYINVTPTPPLAEYLVTDPIEQTPAGCLQRELGRCVSMSLLRSRLARSLSESFDCADYHLYTGHPLLELIGRRPRVIARAS